MWIKEKIGRLTFVGFVLFWLVGGLGLALVPADPALAKPVHIAVPTHPAFRLDVQVLAVPQLGTGGAPPPSTGTPHQATLSWTLPTQPAGVTLTAVKVYRGTVVGTYGLLATLSATTTSYTDSTVQPGLTEHYIATTVAGANESAWSNDAAAPIPNNPNPPGALAATGQ